MFLGTTLRRKGPRCLATSKSSACRSSLALSGRRASRASSRCSRPPSTTKDPETLLERLNAPPSACGRRSTARWTARSTLVVRERIEWFRRGRRHADGAAASALVHPDARGARARPHGARQDVRRHRVEMPHEFNRARTSGTSDCDFFMLATGTGTIFLNKAMVLDSPASSRRRRFWRRLSGASAPDARSPRTHGSRASPFRAVALSLRETSSASPPCRTPCAGDSSSPRASTATERDW